MTKEVTEFMAKHLACKKGREWATRYETMEQVYDACQRGDWLIWLLDEEGVLTKDMAVEIVCRCAEHVLHIWEKKYPTDMRPREAIKAARAVAAHDVASYSADADAAAATAYVAADYDASYAANAAATAYAVASYAAPASDGATAAANACTINSADEQLWQADMIHGLVPNPWRKHND